MYWNLTKNSMMVSPFAVTICDFDNWNQQNWIKLVCFKATSKFGQHLWYLWVGSLGDLDTAPAPFGPPPLQQCFQRLHVGDEIRGNVPGWWNARYRKDWHGTWNWCLPKGIFLLGSFSGSMLNFQGVPIILTNDTSILIKQKSGSQKRHPHCSQKRLKY